MAQVIDNEGIIPGGTKYDIEYDTQNLNSKKKFEPSICSKMCIAWPSRYIIKGYYNSLKAEDMPPLFDSHKTRSTLPKAFKAWDAQVDTWKKNKTMEYRGIPFVIENKPKQTFEKESPISPSGTDKLDNKT